MFSGVSVNLTVSFPLTSESNSRSRSSSDMRPLRLRERWLAVDSRPLGMAVAPLDRFAVVDDDDETTRFRDALSDSDRSWEMACERGESLMEVRWPAPVTRLSADRGGLRFGL